jgi:hypothetical protein
LLISLSVSNTDETEQRIFVAHVRRVLRPILLQMYAAYLQYDKNVTIFFEMWSNF